MKRGTESIAGSSRDMAQWSFNGSLLILSTHQTINHLTEESTEGGGGGDGGGREWIKIQSLVQVSGKIGMHL